MPLKKLGRYDIVAVHAKGAMGQVFDAFDPALKRRVAIKTIRIDHLSDEMAQDLEARFYMETRAAGRLLHPNIISIFDTGRDEGLAYLVMEFVRGEELRQLMRDNARFPLERALGIMRQLLSALNHAHEQGVVHRDVKPGNILIEPSGRLKLGDFGVARLADLGDVTRTQGAMVGTLRYMSPEQIRGEKVDARTDLYSAGVLLYQMLSGQQPFDGTNDFEIMQKITAQAPVLLSQIDPSLPAQFDEVIGRALAKNRDDRFATAADFALALRLAAKAAQATTPSQAEWTEIGTPPQHGLGEAPAAPPRTGSSAVGRTPAQAALLHEMELEYWREIRESDDPADFEEFLVRFRHGSYESLARRKLRRLRALATDGSDGGTGSSTSSAPAEGGLSFKPVPDAPGSARPPEPEAPREDPSATNVAPHLFDHLIRQAGPRAESSPPPTGSPLLRFDLNLPDAGLETAAVARRAAQARPAAAPPLEEGRPRAGEARLLARHAVLQ